MTGGSGASGPPPWFPTGDAAKLLASAEAVIPFVGAGVSRGAQLPDAKKLANWIAGWAPPIATGFSDRDNLMTVVDEIDEEALPRKELLPRVADHVGSEPLNPSPVAKALVRVPSRFIITLNYDLLLEAAADQLGIQYRSLTCRDLEAVFQLLVDEPWPPDELVIVHLHGSVEDPGSIVLDSEGYDRLSNHRRFEHILLLLMTGKTLLFIGTRFDELHIQQKIRKVRSKNRLHVLVAKQDVIDELKSPRAAVSKKRDGILLEAYEDHAQLDGFVERLVGPQAPVPPQPVAPVFRRTLQDYIPNVLRPRGATPSESDELAAALVGRDAWPTPIPEEEVATGHRALIVGAPGSGKSELLATIGEQVPADETAVLIRLRNVTAEAGDAATILGRWARGGNGVGSDAEVGDEAISRRRFHFLLDGLDEVHPAAQERVARMVLEMTKLFPQHRFTVTSRPVSAVTLFPSTENEEAAGGSDWSVLDLVPDRDWQKRYLESRGLTVQQLEEAMPALRDLRELLQLPFFLAKTVDLFNEDRLHGLPDLWALVRGLVSSALAREEGLPLAEDQTRAWLRDVALAMLLRGRLSVTLDELERVPVPEGVVGSVQEITHALVLRLLFNETGDNFSYIHRIVGESLAAEALLELGPQADLLEAIVPVRDELIAGTRNDWLVPLGFLLPRSPEWREAVRERDPLQAARGVPAEADLAERAAAAELIWRTYCAWRIWIWDYDAPDLIEDAEVLGRLLLTEGLEDVIDEVRRGLDDPSPQIQGNSLRVLSRVNPPGFVDDVRRVLEDDGREAVVRRQAAIAARDVGAVELLDLVISRALDPADHAEEQDCTICALDLAGEDRLEEAVLKLAKSRFARGMAESRLGKSVSAEAKLRFWRTAAETESDPYTTDKQRFLDTVKEVLDGS